MESELVSKCAAQQLMKRTRDSVIVAGNLPSKEEPLFAVPGVVSLFSPSGSKLALADPHFLKVVDTASFAEIMSVRHQGVQLLHFAPSESFLLTWKKQQDSEPNLVVWDLNSATPVMQFSQKKFTKDNWPTVVFSKDSSLCFRQVGSELHEFQVGNSTPLATLNQKRVTSYSVSPTMPWIITFTAEFKSEPASIALFQYSEGLNLVQELSIEKGTEAGVHWNRDGTKAIVWSQTDVDTTGRSYYGEHKLYIVSGENSGKQVRTEDGPVHDVKWSPEMDEFIVISGFMPAVSCVFRPNGSKKQVIAKHHRNTVRWNPFGNLVLIGGFGNLQGDIEVYEKSSMNIVGNCRANSCVACEWSPCGKMFVTATLCPRMRVDNGYAIYYYTGEKLITVNAENELYDIAWKPRPGEFQVAPLTPRKIENKPEKKAYRVPGSSSNFAQVFKAAKEGKPSVPHKAVPPPPAKDDYIPGMPEPQKKKRKKKKKNAAQ